MFFYCIAMAVASQPNKLKLRGVPCKAAAASLAIKKGKGRDCKLLFCEGHKKKLPTRPKVNKGSHDPDHCLMQKGSICSRKTEDSTLHKHVPQVWNTAFEANVAMPIRLQSTLKKVSGHFNHCLQTMECFYQDNGLLSCVQYGEGWATIFLDCPVSATSVLECQSCSNTMMTDDTLPECSSCSICTTSMVYDCSNLVDGSCVMLDCDSICGDGDGDGGVVGK